MVSVIRYITHPNVAIDPATPVPEWNLSNLGRQRAEVLLTQPWIAAIDHVYSSGETKALETAQIIADHIGLPVTVLANSGETDRSATGFVEPDVHEALADRFFAESTKSADGWERASDAQQRIATATEALFAQARERQHTVAIVGHGAVGTLLACQLEGLPIDRVYDQPGQGHYWTYDLATNSMVHRWQPIDEAATN